LVHELSNKLISPIEIFFEKATGFEPGQANCSLTGPLTSSDSKLEVGLLFHTHDISIPTILQKQQQELSFSLYVYCCAFVCLHSFLKTFWNQLYGVRNKTKALKNEKIKTTSEIWSVL